MLSFCRVTSVSFSATTMMGRNSSRNSNGYTESSNFNNDDLLTEEEFNKMLEENEIEDAQNDSDYDDNYDYN